MTETIRLSDLQRKIKQTLIGNLSSAVWIVAEISELKSNYSGHCYLTLVEQDERSKKLLAQARATIWASRYKLIQAHFYDVTRQPLKSGVQVLICVEVNFHEVYGLSLNVLDLDPTYTMGDIARQRQEVINRLTEEGVLDMNKEFALPAVIQNIAVVSSETAAGFQDFMKQLEQNSLGIKFNVKLYPALVQGDTAPMSIMNALENIKTDNCNYDAVVIIRGGGAQSDLACFDDYELSRAVAMYSYPVIAGIGHDKDVSIVDMIANRTLKTPTAVAEFIVSKANDFHAELTDTFDNIISKCSDFLKSHQQGIAMTGMNISIATNKALNTKNIILGKTILRVFNSSQVQLKNKENALQGRSAKIGHGSVLRLNRLSQRFDSTSYRFLQQSKFCIKEEINNISHIEKKIKSLDPENIMKQGYCYARVKDKAVVGVDAIGVGDMLVVNFFDGSVEGKVEKVINS